MVASVLAGKMNLHPGSNLKVTSGESEHELHVAGIANDYLGGGSVVYIDRDTGRKIFEFEGIDSLLVTAKQGEAKALHAKLEPIVEAHGVMLQSYDQLRDMLDGMIKGGTAGLWLVLALILIVGALGIVNTLTMNILEQTRELGMLRDRHGTLSDRQDRDGTGRLPRFVGSDLGSHHRTCPRPRDQLLPRSPVWASRGIRHAAGIWDSPLGHGGGSSHDRGLRTGPPGSYSQPHRSDAARIGPRPRRSPEYGSFHWLA